MILGGGDVIRDNESDRNHPNSAATVQEKIIMSMSCAQQTASKGCMVSPWSTLYTYLAFS